MASFYMHPQPSHPPPSGPLPALPKPRQSSGPALYRSTTETASPVSTLPRQLAGRTTSAPSVPLTNDSSSPITLPHTTKSASNAFSRQNPGTDSRKRKLHETISYKSFPKPPIGTPCTISTEFNPGSSSPLIPSPLEAPLRGAQRTFSATTAATSVTSPSLSSPINPVCPAKNPLRFETSSLPQGSYELPEEIKNESTPERRTSRRRSHSLKRKQNVIVSVRIRPDSEGAINNSESEWTFDGRNSKLAFKGQEFNFDNVFTAQDDNAKIYTLAARRIVRKVMEGYHGTIFAYGMTGTGKTFSMQGTDTQPGIIPSAITELFSFIRETPQREFLLRVSYLEIYNESINDLLATSGQHEHIKLREDSRRGVYATPTTEELVQSPTQLLRIIARGDQSRRTSATEYNVRSSRSHAVVQILVESRERSSASPNDKRAPLSGVRVSTLSLIDLAGSEKAAAGKERRTEGSYINKSLLTLGTVISRLSGKASATDKHLPFRDSKLTRLLQPALSGDALVSILCTIQLASGPGDNNVFETLNTLNFAARARNNIVSHAKKAQEAWGDSESRALLDQYRKEIIDLRKQVDEQKTERARAWELEEQRARDLEAEARHEAHMLELELARMALKERIEDLNHLVGSSQGRPQSRAVRQSSFLHLDTADTKPGRTLHQNPLLFQTKTYDEKLNPSGQMYHGDEDDETERGTYSSASRDSTTNLEKQITALSATLQEKDEYIVTLEKLLARARQTTKSPKQDNNKAEAGMRTAHDAVVKDKDAEIAALRERLFDKERMVVALRGAISRSRGIVDSTATTTNIPSPTPRIVSAPFAKAKSSLANLRASSGGATIVYPTPPLPHEPGRKKSSSNIARLTTAANLSKFRVNKRDATSTTTDSKARVPSNIVAAATEHRQPPIPQQRPSAEEGFPFDHGNRNGTLSPASATLSNPTEEQDATPPHSPLVRLTKHLTNTAASVKGGTLAEKAGSEAGRTVLLKA